MSLHSQDDRPDTQQNETHWGRGGSGGGGSPWSPSGSRGAAEVLVPKSEIESIEDLELELKQQKALLQDMRDNVAATISRRIVEAQGQGKEKGREAVRDGMRVLTCVVSEGFAKRSLKEMQKNEEKELEQLRMLKTLQFKNTQLSEFRNLSASHTAIRSSHTAMQNRVS